MSTNTTCFFFFFFLRNKKTIKCISPLIVDYIRWYNKNQQDSISISTIQTETQQHQLVKMSFPCYQRLNLLFNFFFLFFEVFNTHTNSLSLNSSIDVKSHGEQLERRVLETVLESFFLFLHKPILWVLIRSASTRPNEYGQCVFFFSFFEN